MAVHRDLWAHRGHLGWARLLTLALCVGFGVALAVANIRSWELEDANAYWNAALRLRTGGDLYPAAAAVNAPDTYRYAPWFAWIWIPVSLAPKPAVHVGWSAVLVLSSILALVPLLRFRSVAGVCLAALMGGLLIRTASTGNVHPLVIAALVWGVPSRRAPIWIGVTASLKVVPLAYVLIYLGRREWTSAATGLAVAGVLWLPALLYDLGSYPVEPGETFSLLQIGGPVVWAVAALTAGLATIGLARTPYRWLAGSVTAIAALPRLALYDLTYLMTGASGRRQGDDEHGRRAPAHGSR
jgi:Glycosyltransferase family 87